MRRITRKQLLARLFIGFFTAASLLCTVNSAVAGGEELGKYTINGSEEKIFTNATTDPIKPTDPSNNVVRVTIFGPSDKTTPKIYGGYSASEGINVNGNTVFIKPSDDSM